MVYDKIENIGKYAALNKHIPKIVEFLKTHDSASLLNMAVGSYEISGSGCKVLRQSSDTMPLDSRGFEFHRKYTDLQIVLDGVENCYIDYVRDLNTYEGYDEEADICFYQQKADSLVVLYPGMFVILEPNDGHFPVRYYDNTPGHVEKLCFKLMTE